MIATVLMFAILLLVRICGDCRGPRCQSARAAEDARRVQAVCHLFPASRGNADHVASQLAVFSMDVELAGVNKPTGTLVSPEPATTDISISGWEYKGSFRDQATRLLEGGTVPTAR